MPERREAKAQHLRFIGDGSEFIGGAPQRDLAIAEVSAEQVSELVASGLYQLVDGPIPAAAAAADISKGDGTTAPKES